MKKIAVEEVKDVLLSQGFDKQRVAEVIQEMEARLEEDEPVKKGKKPKYQYYVVANTSNLDDDIKQRVLDLPLMVVRQDEAFPHTDLMENLSSAMREYNLVNQDKPKKQVKSIFEGLERVGAKFFRPYNVKRESKEIVMMVETDNKIIFHD